jgi:hypothetical protein
MFIEARARIVSLSFAPSMQRGIGRPQTIGGETMHAAIARMHATNLLSWMRMREAILLPG